MKRSLPSSDPIFLLSLIPKYCVVIPILLTTFLPTLKVALFRFAPCVPENVQNRWVLSYLPSLSCMWSLHYSSSVLAARRRSRRVGEEWGIPLPSRLGYLRSVVSSLAGSGAKPRPKWNFVKSECQTSHLVVRISLNFCHSTIRCMSYIYRTLINNACKLT